MGKISKGCKQLCEIGLHEAAVGLMLLITLQHLPNHSHVLQQQSHLFLLPLFPQHQMQILRADVRLLMTLQGQATPCQAETQLCKVGQFGEITHRHQLFRFSEEWQSLLAAQVDEVDAAQQIVIPPQLRFAASFPQGPPHIQSSCGMGSSPRVEQLRICKAFRQQPMQLQQSGMLRSQPSSEQFLYKLSWFLRLLQPMRLQKPPNFRKFSLKRKQRRQGLRLNFIVQLLIFIWRDEPQQKLVDTMVQGQSLEQLQQRHPSCGGSGQHFAQFMEGLVSWRLLLDTFVDVLEGGGVVQVEASHRQLESGEVLLAEGVVGAEAGTGCGCGGEGESEMRLQGLKEVVQVQMAEVFVPAIAVVVGPAVSVETAPQSERRVSVAQNHVQEVDGSFAFAIGLALGRGQAVPLQQQTVLHIKPVEPPQAARCQLSLKDTSEPTLPYQPQHRSQLLLPQPPSAQQFFQFLRVSEHLPLVLQRLHQLPRLLPHHQPRPLLPLNVRLAPEYCLVHLLILQQFGSQQGGVGVRGAGGQEAQQRLHEVDWQSGLREPGQRRLPLVTHYFAGFLVQQHLRRYSAFRFEFVPVHHFQTLAVAEETIAGDPRVGPANESLVFDERNEGQFEYCVILGNLCEVVEVGELGEGGGETGVGVEDVFLGEEEDFEGDVVEFVGGAVPAAVQLGVDALRLGQVEFVHHHLSHLAHVGLEIQLQLALVLPRDQFVQPLSSLRLHLRFQLLLSRQGNRTHAAHHQWLAALLRFQQQLLDLRQLWPLKQVHCRLAGRWGRLHDRLRLGFLRFLQFPQIVLRLLGGNQYFRLSIIGHFDQHSPLPPLRPALPKHLLLHPRLRDLTLPQQHIECGLPVPVLLRLLLGAQVVGVLLVLALVELLQSVHRHLQLLPPLQRAHLARTDELPTRAGLVAEVEDEPLLLVGEGLEVGEGEGDLGRGELGGVGDGEGGGFGEGAGVGEGVVAAEEEEAVVGEDEALLLLAEDGVGEFGLPQQLRVGLLLEEGEDLRAAQLPPGLRQHQQNTEARDSKTSHPRSQNHCNIRNNLEPSAASARANCPDRPTQHARRLQLPSSCPNRHFAPQLHVPSCQNPLHLRWGCRSTSSLAPWANRHLSPYGQRPFVQKLRHSSVLYLGSRVPSLSLLLSLAELQLLLG